MKFAEQHLCLLFLLVIAAALVIACEENNDRRGRDASRPTNPTNSLDASDETEIIDATVVDENCGILPSSHCNCIMTSESLGDPRQDPSDACYERAFLVF